MHSRWISTRRAGLAVALVLVGAGAAWSVGTQRALDIRARVVEPLPPSTTRAELREADMAFWAGRATRDTLGAEDRAQLAALYLERASTTGGYEDHRRAEQLARASLAIRRGRNGKAAALLANALLAQHRFGDAYEVAAALDAMEPGVIEYRALRGEIALELGRYAEADSLFELVRRQGAPSPSVIARLARWRELSGNSGLAQLMLGEALHAVTTAANARPEDGAWFHLRLSDLALRGGDVAAAKAQLEQGLRGAPDDQRLRDGRAHAALLEDDSDLAIALGEQSVAIVPEPDMLALVSDAYAANGDSARARHTAEAMRRVTLADTGPWHRSWTLFLLDHTMEVPAMLERATVELESRRDIYGYAVYAWALHVSGDHGRALAAARTSLGRHVRDAELYLRAAAIANSAGEDEEAETYLAEGRRINPRFRSRW